MDDAYENMKASSRRLLGEEPDEKSKLQELEEQCCSFCPSLSYQGRMLGFGVSLTIGFVLTLGSLSRIELMIRGNPYPFVLYYSLGNLMSLCGSFFFSGPWKQIRSMFMPVRIWATICYLVTLFLTLFVAFYPGYVPGRYIMLLFLVAIQFASYVWYCISYIPFARRFVSGFWAGLRGR